MTLAVNVTLYAWLALEAGLIVRDRFRGTGTRHRDRGSRLLNIVLIVAAVIAAGIVADRLDPDTTAHLPGPADVCPYRIAGLALMWLGLGLWAIAVLGRPVIRVFPLFWTRGIRLLIR